MSDNGTGMSSPANSAPSGALTSQEVGRRNPKQKFTSGIKIDTNKHGIRRETQLAPKKSGKRK
jgi:hypothetical protein